MADDWCLPRCCEVLWTPPYCQNGHSAVQMLAQWFASWVHFVLPWVTQASGFGTHACKPQLQQTWAAGAMFFGVSLWLIHSIFPGAFQTVLTETWPPGSSCARTEPWHVVWSAVFLSLPSICPSVAWEDLVQSSLISLPRQLIRHSAFRTGVLLMVFTYAASQPMADLGRKFSVNIHFLCGLDHT